MNKSFNVLILKLFEARQAAHIAHLSTSSFSQHMALESFYSELLELVDELVEVYQGEFGLITLEKGLPAPNESDFASYLRTLAKYLKTSNQNLADSYSYYSNIIDEIIALTFRTVYKLENLK
jgi:hypothetical protein